MIYLDNAATTKINADIAFKMTENSLKYFANPSSIHSLGFKSEKIISEARKSFANLTGADSENIIFASGGTESNNIAVAGQLGSKDIKQIITTKIEHSSIYELCIMLEKKGAQIIYAETDSYGRIIEEDLLEKISKNAALVAVSMVNNETGAINNVNRLAEQIKKLNKNTAFHVDAVQALGKISVNLSGSKIDSMSFSSHKIYGPKGIGALYVRDRKKIKPLMYGGKQEFGIRPGTENLPAICGFVEAAEIVCSGINEEYKRTEEINRKYRKLFKEKIEDVVINTSVENSSPYILNVSFGNVLGEVLVRYLEKDEIYLSTGAACSAGISEKSNRVIKSLHKDKKYYEGTIRISFGKDNNLEEVDYVVERIKEYVGKIRKVKEGK